MSHTRYTAIGLFGRKGEDQNEFDAFEAGATYQIPLVASAAAQNTGIFLSPGQILNAFVYVKTPEVTGAVKTISLGIAGGTGTELLSAGDVSSVQVVGGDVPLDVQLSDEITYTLGSADFAELEASLVLKVIQLSEF